MLGFWYVLTQDVVENKMTTNNSLNFIHRNEPDFLYDSPGLQALFKSRLFY
jgi:hypothetical protein